ncbi:hypothetical protein ACWC5I_24485 [Kitasatospora sp. NPDC001574]
MHGLPRLPTRVAERLHESAGRAGTLYGLDLNLVWPRLWSVLPDMLRADVTAARDSYAAAARLAGWGLMYAAPAIVWWPAVLPGSVVVAVAAARARTAAGVLADLVDTAADLHLVDLAGRLGIPAETLSALETGRAVTRRLTRARHAAVPVPGTSRFDRSAPTTSHDAAIASSRRRVNVLRALTCDGKPYERGSPSQLLLDKQIRRRGR